LPINHFRIWVNTKRIDERESMRVELAARGIARSKGARSDKFSSTSPSTMLKYCNCEEYSNYN
jgi:hypothetical protein